MHCKADPAPFVRESDFGVPQGAAAMLAAIGRMDFARYGGKVRLMEVCGTHTMAIAKSGLRGALPENVQLLSGPGCPVCVTPAGALDEALRIASRPGVIMASYGDLLRVPGSAPGDTLAARRARGADVRVVYSAMDCLALARENPARQVVFLGVGFETTAPGTAAMVQAAQQEKLQNLTLLCLLKRTEPALRAILSDEKCRVDGLICPGHVATILGEDGFAFLPRDYGVPGVITGFEAGDLLDGVYRLCAMLQSSAPALQNEYTRAVRPGGNPVARAAVERVFAPAASVWRGLGEIPDSGYTMRPAYAAFDAAARFDYAPQNREGNTGCRCGDVLRGVLAPQDCPLFDRRCTPADPVGPCMVSGEGACAAAYLYRSI